MYFDEVILWFEQACKLSKIEQPLSSVNGGNPNA
jgi:hypothetical protein